ncbi:MAG: large conductance mechanosensitive channel protein MscL [Sphingobacteriales bacterium]|nr:MAG: large conductance mechanosensitive channel protein MscL [Sphingobacteriales bacterium]
MGFFKEFRNFAVKGNVLDLAVGVIIGAAFGKIVSSLVDDIITPAVLQPALNRAHLKNLSELVIPGTAIKYGNFLSQVISFVVVAFVLFLIVKGANKIRSLQEAKEAEKPKQEATPSATETLLAEIRDELRRRPTV